MAQPAVAETNDSPLGSGSETVVPIAELGPLLVTLSVYVTFVPGIAGGGDAVLVSARSAIARLVTTQS